MEFGIQLEPERNQDDRWSVEYGLTVTLNAEFCIQLEPRWPLVR